MKLRSTFARLGAVTFAGTIAGAALVAFSGAPASAHVTVSPSTTAAGSYAVLTFSVGHGCDGSPTSAITISIPEGINAVTPTRNPYYRVQKATEKLDPPAVDGHGNEVTERISSVTYRATTALPDGYRDAFELQVQIPADAEGTDLAFPAVQTCLKGETAWTELPADGQSADDLEHPAPSFLVTAATGDGHAAATDDADDATTTTDEDSGNGLALAGLIVGALGVLLGGAALARGSRAGK